MTLHEAMAGVLHRHGGGWLDRDEIARAIAADGLYLRHDGHAPQSDQLRLRARKYDHLFECSDTACRRIRLRQPAGAPAPRAATREPTTTRRRSERSPRGAQQPEAKGADAARRRRDRAARKYRPKQVELLLVAEAPPAALDRYFYFEDVREQDSLFRYAPGR